jgi:carbamate kinase
VPVTAPGGQLSGADAVIDKDYVAARLAHELGADALVLVTGVPHVLLDFGRPSQRALDEVQVPELEQHLAAGEFAEGSMAPKVRAACQFLDGGGELAVITTPDRVSASLDGPGAGTRVVAARQHVTTGSPGARIESPGAARLESPGVTRIDEELPR